jgi:hypothetical protein
MGATRGTFLWNYDAEDAIGYACILQNMIIKLFIAGYVGDRNAWPKVNSNEKPCCRGLQRSSGNTFGVAITLAVRSPTLKQHLFQEAYLSDFTKIQRCPPSRHTYGYSCPVHVDVLRSR